MLLVSKMQIDHSQSVSWKKLMSHIRCYLNNLDQDVGVLKWRMVTQDEDQMPLGKIQYQF